ncbi:hypothetical protein RRG08_055362 [Elysia crispata]|uniref:Uncharacterized protein n=1 Tax=Elysia crispata TaxID=231223 RepID=A0AAE1AQC7_9GAST|nr:hypothetical protein RRG08_055362 [Elysia crispata]
MVATIKLDVGDKERRLNTSVETCIKTFPGDRWCRLESHIYSSRFDRPRENGDTKDKESQRQCVILCELLALLSTYWQTLNIFYGLEMQAVGNLFDMFKKQVLHLTSYLNIDTHDMHLSRRVASY